MHVQATVVAASHIARTKLSKQARSTDQQQRQQQQQQKTPQKQRQQQQQQILILLQVIRYELVTNVKPYNASSAMHSRLLQLSVPWDKCSGSGNYQHMQYNNTSVADYRELYTNLCIDGSTAHMFAYH